MELRKIPNYILEDLRERMTESQILCSTPEQCFHEYCNWHGLINWGESLVTVLDELRDANK